MAVTALVLYVVWFLLAFGIRTLIAVRRTGDSGWRGLSAAPLTLEWFAGALFAVALFVGLAAPIADLAGVEPVLHSPLANWAGIALASAGVLLTLGAQLSMGDSWRIGVDEHERTVLVTHGAFAVVRNPIFSAMVITAAGLVLIVPNVIAIVGFVALVVALELQVRGVEEPYLSRVHGDAYRRYADAVGRFVPRIGRHAQGVERTR